MGLLACFWPPLAFLHRFVRLRKGFHQFDERMSTVQGQTSDPNHTQSWNEFFEDQKRIDQWPKTSRFWQDLSAFVGFLCIRKVIESADTLCAARVPHVTIVSHNANKQSQMSKQSCHQSGGRTRSHRSYSGQVQKTSFCFFVWKKKIFEIGFTTNKFPSNKGFAFHSELCVCAVCTQWLLTRFWFIWHLISFGGQEKSINWNSYWNQSPSWNKLFVHQSVRFDCSLPFGRHLPVVPVPTFLLFFTRVRVCVRHIWFNGEDFERAMCANVHFSFPICHLLLHQPQHALHRPPWNSIIIGFFRNRLPTSIVWPLSAKPLRHRIRSQQRAEIMEIQDTTSLAPFHPNHGPIEFFFPSPLIQQRKHFNEKLIPSSTPLPFLSNGWIRFWSNQMHNHQARLHSLFTRDKLPD